LKHVRQPGNGLGFRRTGFRTYLLGLVLVALPLAYVFTAIPETSFVGLPVDEADYLVKLRNSGPNGCTTLFARRPEVMFIGDSHSYAGWDFRLAQEKLDKKVGGCLVGGMYIESVPLVLSKLGPDSWLPFKSGYVPDVIVLGVSPRMFWEADTKQQQVENTAEELDGLSSNSLIRLFDAAAGVALAENEDKTAAKEDLATAWHRPRIMGLNLADIESRLDNSRGTVDPLVYWTGRLANVEYSSQIEATINQICNRSSSLGVDLYVVHIPESPYLEAGYDSKDWDSYMSAVKALERCAVNTVINTSAEYGLDNRHFVNRYLTDQDYSAWSREDGMIEAAHFDPDHMNPFGAELFTAKSLRLLFVTVPSGVTNNP
jgi:hypothetical protein